MFLWFVLGAFPMLVFAAGSDCADLTTLQRIAGYASWKGFVQIMAIIMITAGVLYMFWGVIETILSMKKFMEILLWWLTVGLVVGTYFTSSNYQLWPLLIGSILIPFAINYSVSLRETKLSATRFSALLMVVWSVIAIFYQASGVGFLAIGALMAVMGFSMAVGPFSYSFGFKNDDEIAQGTISGLLVMAAYIAVHIAKVNLGLLQVFESGALWLGSFVGFLGLLILSSRWYERGNNWVVMNIVTIMFLSATISIGMLYGIREITTMGGAFLLFYLAAKPMEIKTKEHFAFGVKLMMTGGVLASAWHWLSMNPEMTKQYFNLWSVTAYWLLNRGPCS